MDSMKSWAGIEEEMAGRSVCCVMQSVRVFGKFKRLSFDSPESWRKRLTVRSNSFAYWLFVHVEERQETKPEALIAAECNYGTYLWEG